MLCAPLRFPFEYPAARAASAPAPVRPARATYSTTNSASRSSNPVKDGRSEGTTALVVRAGANALVAGSYVFKGGPAAYAANIAAIREAATAAL